jgi:two-component system response regulator (stage 0 sporulation protein F)
MAKILIVDDELRIRELLYKVLSKEGYQVITTPSAEQTFAYITREPFDLVLLDIKLAGESGISILKKIRELQQKIPVIIYSGVITADLEKDARTAGANEVLSKTVEITQLVQQIKKFIKGKDRLFQDPSERLKKSILIVDDEPEIRNVLVSFFRKKGYKNIEEAANGEQALQLARSQMFSVALLDINMPGMDGLTTLKKLLEINPKLGVVMVTGRQEDENVNKAIEMGAYSYVLKPFDLLYLELVVMSKLDIAEG